jgi:hypothetical protein
MPNRLYYSKGALSPSSLIRDVEVIESCGCQSRNRVGLELFEREKFESALHIFYQLYCVFYWGSETIWSGRAYVRIFAAGGPLELAARLLPKARQSDNPPY